MPAEATLSQGLNSEGAASILPKAAKTRREELVAPTPRGAVASSLLLSLLVLLGESRGVGSG